MKPLICFCFGISFAAAAAADVKVSQFTGVVSLLRDGDAATGTVGSGTVPVSVGMTLADGDELIGGSSDASVQLECSGGATQTLWDQFDAVINSAQAPTKCAVDLNAGTVVAAVAPDASSTGENAPSVQGGPYALLATHTQFGLSMQADAPDEASAFVIEGEATVLDKTVDASRTLKHGQYLSFKVAAVAEIPPATYERAAVTYARLDSARLGSQATPQVQAQLKANWYAVLTRPGDQAARAKLTSVYAAHNLSGTAIAKYQASQVMVHGPAQQLAVPQDHGIPGALVTQPAQQRFANPMQGSDRLDYCLHWGNSCGQPAADAFCRSQNYARASQFTAAWDIGASTPTRVMGDNLQCSEAYCDGFAEIVCSK